MAVIWRRLVGHRYPQPESSVIVSGVAVIEHPLSPKLPAGRDDAQEALATKRLNENTL